MENTQVDILAAMVLVVLVFGSSAGHEIVESLRQMVADERQRLADRDHRRKHAVKPPPPPPR